MIQDETVDRAVEDRDSRPGSSLAVRIVTSRKRCVSHGETNEVTDHVEEVHVEDARTDFLRFATSAVGLRVVGAAAAERGKNRASLTARPDVTPAHRTHHSAVTQLEVGSAQVKRTEDELT